MKQPKELKFTLKDRVAAFFDHAEELVPPKKIAAMVGGGDFKAVGEEFLRLFVQLGGLKANSAVLDMGCGCGRIAVPLLKYLDATGSYEGLDIMKVAIDWCQKNISARNPRFSFKLADVYNCYYNPGGQFAPSEYRFPYNDNQFDFAVFTSVFPRLQPKDMRHYMAEAVRVLKPGGKCFMTFFVLNADSQSLMKSSGAKMNFRFPRAGYFAAEERKVDETAIAFDEPVVRDCINEQRMRLEEPIHFGSWSGRKNFSSFQDILIAVKT
jgi:ubiquinone/menaquinone biosynthesis C-methylase UbiE